MNERRRNYDDGNNGCWYNYSNSYCNRSHLDNIGDKNSNSGVSNTNDSNNMSDDDDEINNNNIICKLSDRQSIDCCIHSNRCYSDVIKMIVKMVFKSP